MRTFSEIEELLSLRLNPSDLYNIERPKNVNPDSGGGHTYIQIPQKLVQPTLSFLGEDYPPLGHEISLSVHDQAAPESPIETVEFWSKSAGRMRIAKQNRHRHGRLTAWSSIRGFPVLEETDTTEEARAVLNELGGLHLYFVRARDGLVWAGFTHGSVPENQRKQPFADLLWGSGPGGYWSLDGERA